MNIPGFELCDCGFDFLHSTHVGKVSLWRADDKSANGARYSSDSLGVNDCLFCAVSHVNDDATN